MNSETGLRVAVCALPRPFAGHHRPQHTRHPSHLGIGGRVRRPTLSCSCGQLVTGGGVSKGESEAEDERLLRQVAARAASVPIGRAHGCTLGFGG